MCVDWISIYYFMLIEFILKVNVDNVIVMWIVYGEMVNWKWMLMNCFEIDWIMCCCWEWCDYDICELKIEILSYVDDLRWFELLRLWIGSCGLDWNEEIVNCLCFDGNELVV